MGKSLTIAVAITLAGITCFAQNTQPAIIEDFKPSVFNQPFQQYPQVNSQGYARFRILAPNADSVRVSLGLGGQGGTKLIKADSGYFIGTTAGPMDEGFHYYHINVDGGTFNDPGTGFSMAHNVGKAVLKYLRKTRIFMRLKMFLMETCSRSCSLQKARTHHGLHLFTLPRVTKKVRPNTRYYTCNMVGVKMRLHGVFKAVLT